MHPQWLRTLRLFLLIPVVLPISAPVLAQTSAEATPHSDEQDIEEPEIDLPELQTESPFRSVSRSRRRDTEDALILLCREAVETTSRRLLSTDQHTPWQMMHALLGLRHDFQILHNGQAISGLDWITRGQVFDNEYWFERTQFGGRAHPYNRPYAFEGHANQFLAILSMCGVELDQEFGTENGPITMRDMIKHAQMSVSTTDEPTWTLWGLSRYLPPSARWKNAKGEMWSIEKLVQSQCQKPIVRGAPCGGTHALFALTHARNVYQQQGKPLRGVWLQAQYKIRQFINTARMQQNSNGTLSSNFFRGRKYDPDFNKRMASAGHLLEFLMISMEQQELNTRWVRRALEATSRDLLNNRKAYVKCSPLYHSVNALNIYLDRVNPKLPLDEIAADPEPLRTVQLPKSGAPKGSLKPVPITSIGSSRDVTSGDAAPEQLPELAEPKMVETPAIVDSPKGTALQPVEPDEPTVADTTEPMTDDAASESTTRNNVPLLRDLNVTKDAIEKDRSKWRSTPKARRTPMTDSDNAGKNSVPAVSSPITEEEGKTETTLPVVEEPLILTPGTTQKFLRESRPDVIEPNAGQENMATKKINIPMPAKEDKDKEPSAELGLPVTSVSKTKLLDSKLPSTADLYGDSGNRATVPVGLNAPFLDTELNTQEWQLKFESKSREVFAGRSSIVTALGLRDGMTVADVGCGTGLFVKAFSTAVGPTGRVFAIDIAPRFVEYVEGRVEAEKLDNVTVVRNEPTSLMLMQHKVDRVLLCDTYRHFEYHKKMLASIFASLHPGGELIVVDIDRIPEQSRTWILENVRADKQTFTSEISNAGFEYIEEVAVPDFNENYLLRFRKPGIE